MKIKRDKISYIREQKLRKNETEIEDNRKKQHNAIYIFKKIMRDFSGH